MLHWNGIGDAGWYRKLKCELEKNIEELRNRRESNRWWRST
jgi:hypothetical protein